MIAYPIQAALDARRIDSVWVSTDGESIADASRDLGCEIIWRPDELGGDHVPSQRFGVNSAWFKIALLTYNIVSAIKGLCLEGEERSVRLKKFRLLLIHVAGRMNRNNCVMGLRLCNNTQALQRMQRVWKIFELPTQATAAKALGRRGG